jgi:hypothetical protein
MRFILSLLAICLVIILVSQTNIWSNTSLWVRAVFVSLLLTIAGILELLRDTATTTKGFKQVHLLTIGALFITLYIPLWIFLISRWF